MSVRLLAFAATLRRTSLNRRLLGVAVEAARQRGAEVDVAEFREFDVPLYDGDLQSDGGIPPGALGLQRRLEAADGWLLASPEYNYSMPGTLKNLIDWVSRIRPNPLKAKSAMLLSTSTGLVGGNRGLWALRVPLESLGVVVHPAMFSLPLGDKALDADDRLVDPAQGARLEQVVGEYLDLVKRLRG